MTQTRTTSSATAAADLDLGDLRHHLDEAHYDYREAYLAGARHDDAAQLEHALGMVRELRRLREEADRQLQAAVVAASLAGASFGRIAEQLAVSKQAAHKRYSEAVYSSIRRSAAGWR